MSKVVDDKWGDDKWVPLRAWIVFVAPGALQDMNYLIIRSYSKEAFAAASSKYTRVGKIGKHYMPTCRPYWRFK